MNKRAETIHHSADSAASIAFRIFRRASPLDSRAEYEEALREAKSEIMPMLFNNLHPTFKHAVADLVDECRSQEAAMRMGHYDPRDFREEGQDEGEATLRSEELQRILQEAVEDLKELRSHRCQWDEDPDTGAVRCMICGADGLA
ncbi:MAG: hypothetical protein H0U65_05315 [Rubrobacter sp.]|jgi:hypothetical protein|nr:hypothetical protein [Rubrobacter sp.]